MTRQSKYRIVLPPCLYAILDPAQCRRRQWVSVLHSLLEGGTRVIQLRAKSLDSRAVFELARETRKCTLAANCILIVNDRVDIALATDADGVHLGQEDLPLAVARNLMKGKMIGVSTHDLDQAREADQGGADYIGFGPVFATSTKDTGYSARGLSGLRDVCRAVQIPVVAIGGITEVNITQVWQAGAHAGAMISDLLKADDIKRKTDRILALYQASSASS